MWQKNLAIGTKYALLGEKCKKMVEFPDKIVPLQYKIAKILGARCNKYSSELDISRSLFVPLHINRVDHHASTVKKKELWN